MKSRRYKTDFTDLSDYDNLADLLFADSSNANLRQVITHLLEFIVSIEDLNLDEIEPVNTYASYLPIFTSKITELLIEYREIDENKSNGLIESSNQISEHLIGAFGSEPGESVVVN